MSNGTTTPIERTPNIGSNLAAELRSVGIDSLEALMRVGFWDAWLQLRRANPERNSVPACLARRDQSFVACLLDIAGRTEGHALRKLRPARDPHGRGLFKIRGDQQGNVRQPLHLVEEHRHGVRIGIARRAVLDLRPL